MSSNAEKQDIAKLSERIIALISKRNYDEAKNMIEAARKYLPPDQTHRLTALTAVLQDEMGNSDESIELIRQALREKPGWLPHVYRLSVFLMDAERWYEANAALDQLISLSEDQHDVYFLGEARFRKIICLKALGRDGEIPEQKAKIDPETRFFIGSKSCRLSDLD